MKKLFLLIAIAATAVTASAQNGGSEFKIGIGGAFNSTWLFNSNVSAQAANLNYVSTFGGTGGISLTYTFNDNTGITSGVFMAGQNQDYNGTPATGTSFTASSDLGYINIPVLFRMGGADKGAYFEIGPQIGFLTSATETVTSTPSSITDFSSRDVKSQFNSTNFSGVLGFGGQFILSNNLSLTAGLRLGYGFTDATIQHTQADLATLVLNGQASFADYWAHYTQSHTFNYTPTNAAFGGIFISLMYKVK